MTWGVGVRSTVHTGSDRGRGAPARTLVRGPPLRALSRNRNFMWTIDHTGRVMGAASPTYGPRTTLMSPTSHSPIGSGRVNSAGRMYSYHRCICSQVSSHDGMLAGGIFSV